MAFVPFDELGQRVHDYRHLIARWRQVARAAGLALRPFAKSGKLTYYYLQTPGSAQAQAIYLSAGIHGDEPASTEGLLRWAERRLPALMRRKSPPPLLIFPCLNPWGLMNNQRTDAGNVDLNRVFDREDIPPVGELKRLIAGRRFALCVALHEDYDARGFYVYEINRRPAEDWGEALLAAGAEVLPIETRSRIDGRPFKNGLMRRRINLRKVRLHPESIYLYLHHTDHTLTLETPSEFSLSRRVETIVRLIDECVRRGQKKG
jgi:protein MpaA